MKQQLLQNKTLLFAGLLSLLLSLSSMAQKKDVVIRVVQDETSVALSEFQTTIRLKNKGFKFQVMLENTKGVYVFASIRDSIYRFTETSPIRDFEYLPLLELSEDEFNQNKELNISETGWSYWFYDSSVAWHPFNSKIVGLGNGRIVGTKYIKHFFDVAERNIIKIKEMEKPLYLFFVAVSEYTATGSPSKELLRRKLKIDWVNED
jgi:hypothetical protein